jgi:hypothetical protein
MFRVFKYDNRLMLNVRTGNFTPKNVKKSENGNKPAKNTLGFAILQ